MGAIWRTLYAITLICLAAVGQAQTQDSTNVGGAGTLPASNCQNIAGIWYGPAQLPVGYYKQSAAPFDCKPIQSCTSNQEFNTSAEACQCPAGTSWDSSYSICHTPCGGGTAWNGASCTSVCTGGQTWNGSACACPAGQVWNGSTCGAVPNINSFSMSPASQTVGSNYTASWSVTGASTLSLNCTGANATAASLTPVASGTRAIPASMSGATACTVTAANAYGSDTASTSLTAACAAGTTWNGSSCVSVCSGGQAWNGSACVCPVGQGWDGTACGTAPVFSGFSISPASVTVGSNYTVSWGASGFGVTVTMNCTGANPASYTLNPAAGGSGALVATKAGTTNCTATASNSWGSNAASDSAIAVCAAGKTWNGTACVPAASGCPAVSGSSGYDTGNSLANLSQALGSTVSTGWYQGYAQIMNAYGPGTTGQSVNQTVQTGWCGSNPAMGSCGMMTYSVPHTCQSSGTWTATCPGTNWWNGTTCMPPRFVNVLGRFNTSSQTVMRVTAITTSKVVVSTMSGSTVVQSCTLTSPGQTCHLRGGGSNAGTTMMDWMSNSMKTAQEIVTEGLWVDADSGRFGSIGSARLNADGSISLWFYYAGGTLDFYQTNANANRVQNSGTIPSTWQNWAAGSTNSASMAWTMY